MNAVCEALWWQTQEPCRDLAHEKVDGHALCYVHARTVAVGYASLRQVLEGERSQNPADHGGKGNRR